MGKTILIVFAHPERHSFNGALLDGAIGALEKQGHRVLISDLYSMKFKATLDKEDIKGPLKQPEGVNMTYEMKEAAKEGRLSPDITSEQEKVRSADLVVFQFPLWWMGFPAIMKGWCERVLCNGFAVDIPEKVFDLGFLKGKKAMLSTTLGGPRGVYSNSGCYGDVDVMLWPLQSGILRFCGFDVLAPHLVYGLDSPAAAQAVLAGWTQRLQGVFQELPLHFYNMADFEWGPEGDQILRPDVMSTVTGPYGPTVGQHCGKPLPPGSQSTVPSKPK